MEGVGLYSKLQLPLMGWICQNTEKFSTPKGQGDRDDDHHFQRPHIVLEMTPPEI